MARPVVLIILDGWGVAPKQLGNPIIDTPTPFFDRLEKEYPYATLGASGDAVGLPNNQSGNSEAGHVNIGAGRVVEQDSYIISRSISNGTFFQNDSFLGAFDHVKNNKSRLHLMGILSGDQSPHMDPNHLLALITFAKQKGIKKVYLHFFTDGRDSYYYSGKDRLKNIIQKYGKQARVASVIGRLYLDRKKNWIRTKEAYEALILGKGKKSRDPIVAVRTAYRQGQTDEFISPIVCIDSKGDPIGMIQDNDAVIFFNLRSDRARQLTKIFVQKDFSKLNKTGFKEPIQRRNLFFVAMTDFGPDLPRVVTAFPSKKIIDTLPFVLRGKKQMYIAESEKYAHMTYFLNGGYSEPVAGEERIFFQSPHTDSYARTPAMRVPDIVQSILKNLGKKDFIAANFASPDMIGHTGNIMAASQVINIIDDQLSKLATAIDKVSGTLVITADHGNIEEIIDEKSHKVDTRHSHFPVPLHIYGKAYKNKKFKKLKDTKLADVAPTILTLLSIKQPQSMKGRSFL